jgi:hypothetical protein
VPLSSVSKAMPPAADAEERSPGVCFISQWYATPNEARNREIDECVRANLSNPAFTEWIWFVAPGEDEAGVRRVVGGVVNGGALGRDGGSEHVRIIPIAHPTRRLTFGEALGVMDGEDTVYVLANSDIIVPPESVPQMVRWVRGGDEAGLPVPRVSLCLTRHERTGGEPKIKVRPHHSQDTWVIRGGRVIAENLAKATRHIALGIPGCDNRMAWELKRVGAVLNPCRSIVTVHVHASQVRSYTKKTRPVPRPYHYVVPC